MDFHAWMRDSSGAKGVEQQMNMVRHDDPRVVFTAFTFIEFQNALQNLPVGGFLEQTGAYAFIQPLFQPPDDAPIVFRLLFDGPWHAPCLLPKHFVALPLADLFIWQRISEPEGDELHHLILFPVGKNDTMFVDGPVGKEEVTRHLERMERGSSWSSEK